ncbi:bifunctional salicylyl-CoA 5-hydroxylase/oxidoreductase [Halomonas urumqiensis]|uniref:Bifunctional salicylyl-CoA 5-hydroxylase/oxidoreductase n=1 Tax=Halomonas urumqiensis TaxID=1684789 RepID=A0A2N7UCC3_9GAMM|nr:bifunctional salicylyl-CoA 5-hydroxylase/oxidoreductase [Halomonas urumqiensis]PMR78093.1 bifunctional salicylyl-CoA 5-hydroxylase/oxidoreductase [Halomonas urumqiensis]PTB03244.1 bifunctional salicylyl-CoA 5-hydroxylase/oxidoreductase [Halomonas urumqiensis]GHE20601.1 NADH:flavin oxidoreductase [Halomonas urumqiensis]
MRIACLGGGPAGLYFAISMKRHDPSHEIVVIERNQPDDTFGWGVVLSDETLDNLAANDAPSAERIREHFAYWDDIAVIHQGVKTVSTGHGFCGIGRHKLLVLLQERARELGVELRFGCELDESQIDSLRHEYDMVLAADGLNSRTRTRHAEHFKPDIDVRACKFVWLGTHQTFNDAFTFIFEKTEHGWVWAHAYQFDDDTATFIVECNEATWQAFGFGEMSQQESIAVCERIFARHLGGHSLMSNANHIRGSAWINFPRVLCERWSFDNVVLMGDAAATAHFSIGSGTKLALESAIALADYLHSEPDLPAAFDRYEEERRTEVLRLQSAARNSTEWFEQVERYLDLDPVQFNYSLLTRSQRISHENLRLRDPQWLASAEGWFQAQAGNPDSTRPPMFAPFQLRDMALANRVVVSPMAQYKAIDGCPTDWHFAHYAERAKGGAGLVYTEMTCVTPEGRITPGCPGFYSSAHEVAWKRLCDFVHAETPAKLCAQIGHSGPKGSTQLGWEEMDAPLPEGNWPIMAASAVPWAERNQVPKAMDRADMDAVRDAFVDAARMADRAGFDMLEVHAAHGYLLSSFITPLTNRRDDEYGGSLDNRLRYPLEVIGAVRDAWPAHKPLSVRISANDWVGEEGITPDDAVEIAHRLKAADVDIVDVSAGQTSTQARPVYGRMFQTPFSDRIRNETGMATMAVGNIYQADHVNSILMAGRADLVCLARPHLADPYWTLHVAAALGDREAAWPAPYRAGADQLKRLAERGEGWV